MAEMGLLSPPLPVHIDGIGVETLDAGLQNLELKEGDKNSGEQASGLKDEKKRRFNFPIRPAEPDCSFYMRTGTCRFGFNCKFNHPSRRRNQASKDEEQELVIAPEKQEKEKEEKMEEGEKMEKEKEKAVDVEWEEEKENDKEEFHEKERQQECKYYQKTGGCKFGKACRYNHSKVKAGSGEHVDLNFLGLPLRPGERECPFYMRTGSCKFEINCKFHHPDPTAVGSASLPAFPNGTSICLHASTASSPPPSPWPLQRPSNDTLPYVGAPPNTYSPAMLPHGVHPNLDWNRYMGLAGSIYSPERHVQLSPPTATNSPTTRTDNSSQLPQTTRDEFPERPGQTECQYYMKFGDCKFKSACRYHHPKKTSIPTACALNPMGLPLRPDQTVCVHYNRYGICKFGPACKYDHPMNSEPSAAAVTIESDNSHSLQKPASEEAGVLTC